jgi:hypothetical protein
MDPLAIRPDRAPSQRMEWNRYPGRFTVIFGVITLLLFVLEHINGRFWLNDFRVYYGAGEALLNGEPLYGVAHGLGTGIFKYAPALALFYALFALLPYSIAASIQYVLITLAFLDGMRRIDRSVRAHWLNGKAPSYAALFVTALIGVVHLHRELHLGNINMMLLWLLVVAMEELLKGRSLRGGAILGIAILAKPHFLVLLPLLILRRKWNVGGMVLATIAAGVLVPALFLGWGANIAVHRTWLHEMAAHNASLIYTGGDDYRAVNTIYSFVHRAVLQYFVGTPSITEILAILAVIAGSIGGFVLWNQKRNSERDFSFEFLLLVGLVPCITLTDTEHFLLALPMVALLVQRLLPTAVPRWLAYLTVPLLLAYGANWEDALGALSDRMVHFGVLGIGTFGILVLCTLLWIRSNQTGPDAS